VLQSTRLKENENHTFMNTHPHPIRNGTALQSLPVLQSTRLKENGNLTSWWIEMLSKYHVNILKALSGLL